VVDATIYSCPHTFQILIHPLPPIQFLRLPLSFPTTLPPINTPISKPKPLSHYH